MDLQEGSICAPRDYKEHTVEGDAGPLPIAAPVWNRAPNLPHSSLPAHRLFSDLSSLLSYLQSGIERCPDTNLRMLQPWCFSP